MSEDAASGVTGQPPLPLDLDVPVPYELTARARRLVAPDSLPDLSVVRGHDPDDDHVPRDLDDPHDPRSARARALRRSGMSVAEIARRLDVDEVVVRGWIGDIGAGRRAGSGRRARRLRPVRADRTEPTGPVDGPTVDHGAIRAGFAAARAAATSDAPTRMASATFVRGLALVAATAEVDLYAVVVAVRDLDIARTVRRWLEQEAGVDRRDVRVVLRLGSRAGSDLVVHRWAEALDVPSDRVSRTHWQAAPSSEAVEALVRVADPEVAARVAGWRDVLLGVDDLDPSSSDLAF